MPDLVLELSASVLTSVIQNFFGQQPECHATTVLDTPLLVTDINVLGVQPARGDSRWVRQNDPGGILNKPGFLSSRQTPSVALSSGSPTTVTTVASLLLVDLSLRLDNLGSSGYLASNPQPYARGHPVYPESDPAALATFVRDSGAVPGRTPIIQSLALQASASANGSGGIDLFFAYLGALGTQSPVTAAQFYAIAGLNQAFMDTSGATPLPVRRKIISFPAPANSRVVNAGLAVPPWDTYASPAPGLRLGLDLALPDDTTAWTAFYQGQGWSLPAGHGMSVAIDNGLIAARLKSQTQAALTAGRHPQTIRGSFFQATGPAKWQASMEVHDPTLGYLGNAIIDVTPTVTPPTAQEPYSTVVIAACVSFSGSIGLDLKAALAGVLTGGVIGGFAGGVIGGVVFGVVAAILASNLGASAMNSGLIQAGAQGALPSCTPPDGNNCMTCSFTPDLSVPGLGTLVPAAFYAPAGYVGLCGDAGGPVFTNPPAVVARVDAWEGYTVIPCQGLSGGSLPLTISNGGDFPALICSITQRTQSGGPPPVLGWSIQGSASPPALPILVPGGGTVALSVTAPPGYANPLTLTIATTAGCFELELPVPAPQPPSQGQVALGSMLGQAMCTVLVNPLPMITNVTYTDPLPFQVGSILQERIWASAEGLAADAQLVARTETGAIVATAPAVRGSAALTASVPITEDPNQSHLFIQLVASSTPSGAQAFTRSLYRLRTAVDLHQRVSAASQVDSSRFRLQLSSGVIEGKVSGQLIEWQSLNASANNVRLLARQRRLRLRPERPDAVVRIQQASHSGSSRFTTSGDDPILEVSDNGWLSSLVYDGEIAVEVQEKTGRILIWDELPTLPDLKGGFCTRLMARPEQITLKTPPQKDGHGHAPA